MSRSIAYLRSAPFITLKFADDDLSGRVNDSYGVSAYHIYSSRGVLGNLKSTIVTRSASGETVAEIQWGGLTRQRRAIIHGRDWGKLLQSDVDGLKLLGSRRFCFHDEAGNDYYWKKEECYNTSGRVVACYSRKLMKFVRTNEPAMLSVDPNYCEPSVFDYIMVSALMMEKKRKDAEKQKRRRDAKSSSTTSSSGVGPTLTISPRDPLSDNRNIHGTCS